MQMSEAERLRQEWGDKPCSHPKVEREYYLGTDTGDYDCTTCGECFASKEEWREAQAKAEQRAD